MKYPGWTSSDDTCQLTMPPIISIGSFLSSFHAYNPVLPAAGGSLIIFPTRCTRARFFHATQAVALRVAMGMQRENRGILVS